MKKVAKEIKNCTKGATFIEYALMIALIAGIAVAAVTFLGGKMSNSFNRIGNVIDTNTPQ